MQYFIFLFWLSVTLLPPFIFVRRARLFRKNFISHALTDMLINQPRFSTIVLRNLTSYIFKQPPALKKQLIQNILQKKLSLFQKNLPNTDLRKQLRLLTRNTTVSISNCSALTALLAVENHIDNHRYTKARQVLRQINSTKSSTALAGLYIINEAKLAFYEGDLLNSSSWCHQAITLFKKQKMLCETADTYFLLGQIYQTASAHDASELTLREALKIFKHLQRFSACAKTLCLLGIVTASQERWDEARQFFNEALDFARRSPDSYLQPYILCRQALLDVCLNNHHQAVATLTNLKFDSKNNELSALYNDIFAQAHFALSHYKTARIFALKAQQLYISDNNIQAAQAISQFISKIENII